MRRVQEHFPRKSPLERDMWPFVLEQECGRQRALLHPFPFCWMAENSSFKKGLRPPRGRIWYPRLRPCGKMYFLYIIVSLRCPVSASDSAYEMVAHVSGAAWKRTSALWKVLGVALVAVGSSASLLDRFAWSRRIAWPPLSSGRSSRTSAVGSRTGGVRAAGPDGWLSALGPTRASPLSRIAIKLTAVRK